ncbi:MAG: hypothetical protein NTW59_05455 [Candidatus Diapherotrites archaeon]|nr:hypothetical protein [Candidatus Diapherotrites archaeon]
MLWRQSGKAACEALDELLGLRDAVLKVKGVKRVFLDLTPKPAALIELM